MRLEAELSQAGYVVLVDGYDPGWRATIDGRGVPVLRANVAFRAVAVPPGRHVIEYRYRPTSVALHRHTVPVFARWPPPLWRLYKR